MKGHILRKPSNTKSKFKEKWTLHLGKQIDLYLEIKYLPKRCASILKIDRYILLSYIFLFQLCR